MAYLTLRDGTRICYDDLGSGPPLLLVHGFLMSRHLWMYQIAELRDRYRIIAPDLRGHGESDRPAGSYAPDQHAADLVELLEALNLAGVAVAGWSMGGQVVAALYQRARERIDRLAIINGTVCMLADDEYPYGRTPEAHARNIAALKEDYPGLVRSFVQSIFSRDVGQAMLDFVEQIAFRVPLWVALDQWEAMGRTDLRDVLPEIAGPCLLLHGTEDLRISPRVAEWMAERVKQPRLVLLDDIGHTPFIEDPATFNAALEEWLKT